MQHRLQYRVDQDVSSHGRLETGAPGHVQRLPLEGRADAVGVSSLITWSFGTFGHRGGFPQRIAIAVEHPIATVKREGDTRVFGLEFYPP